LDEETSKYGGLTQEIGFDSAEVHTLRWLKKGAAATTLVHLQRIA
jgi:hypothetical protein